MNKKLIFVSLYLLLFVANVFSFNSLYSQESTLMQDKIEYKKAIVLEVVDEKRDLIPGTDVYSTFQKLKVKILDDSQKEIIIDDDHLKLEKGDKFILRYTIRAEDNKEIYNVEDSSRLPFISILTVIFILLVIIIGGMQGFRGLLSLIGSLLLIVYILIPGILKGYSPILMSIAISSLIIVLGSYITHGFNKTTSSAVFGMIITVVLTGVLAYASIDIAKLTGFESDEAVYLNLSTRGSIDISGILLSGIMIGLLGVLYDVAIGQAISVEELHKIAPNVSRRKIYLRALRMGREHIGALVNTLAIAYVGTSLPLLLLFSLSDSSTLVMINKEIFSAEIIRTLIGSIGLILAVPITTLISVFIVVKNSSNGNDIDESKISHIAHSH